MLRCICYVYQWPFFTQNALTRSSLSAALDVPLPLLLLYMRQSSLAARELLKY